MPHYVMIGWDGEDGAARRDQHRAAHVNHITLLNEQGKIAFAGPIRDHVDQRSVGAVIVYAADSLSAARELVNGDPYVSGGVFAQVHVHPFRLALPQPPA